MKRFLILTSIVAIILGLSSCGNIDEMDEATAVKTVQVLSSGFNEVDDSAGSRGLGATVDNTFTYEQSGGGVAEFVYSSDYDGEDSLTNAVGTFSVSFTDYEVAYTDEDDNSTVYTLDGTMYYEYTYAFTIVNLTTYTYSYKLLFYTRDDDTLHITGADLDTDIEIDVVNSLDYSMTLSDSSTSAIATYDCTGTVNGYVLSGESGTFSLTM